MRKLLTILAFTGIATFAKAETAKTSSYILDETAVVNTIQSAEDITPTLVSANFQGAGSLTAEGTMKVASQSQFAYSAAAGKSAVAAILLDIFLGSFGIHRFYLGTAVLTGIGYILTLGICGIVPFVDLIVLIINVSDISEYEDNPKFFMW